MQTDARHPNPSTRAPLATIFGFGLFLFLAEFLIFKSLLYLTDYLTAVLVVAYALIGIGIGGYAAARFKLKPESVFDICLVGMWLSVIIVIFKITRFPSIGLSNITLCFVFMFPALYLAGIFTKFPSFRAYAADMSGAATAVALLPCLYWLMSTESIFLLLLTALPLFGIAFGGHGNPARSRNRIKWLYGLMAVASFTLFLHDQKYNSFDFFHCSVQNPKSSEDKVFGKNLLLKRSYDDLVCRTDVVQPARASRQTDPHHVAYEGYPNDHFDQKKPGDFTNDIRVVMRQIKDPRVFIIGPSAQGIFKPVISMTPSKNIEGLEINPAAVSMMSRDFIFESGGGYRDLPFKTGNGLAYLKNSKERFDIITLINVHSMPRISSLGPPDFLHTVEAYKTYLSRLTDVGYIMLEERPMNIRGEYGVYKLVATASEALRQLGASDPSQHFFIFGWRSQRSSYAKHTYGTYAGIMIRKTPITQKEREGLLRWWEKRHRLRVYKSFTPEEIKAGDDKSNARLQYLSGFWGDADYTKLFKSLKYGSVLEDYPDWDLTPITRDKPFSSQSTHNKPEIQAMALLAFSISLCLLLIVIFDSMRQTQSRRMHGIMLIYQIAIGCAYLLAEICFMQMYQEEFVAPSFAFAGTLAVLLLSSALGGELLSKLTSKLSALLILLATFGAHWLLRTQVMDLLPNPQLKITLVLILVAASGLIMGWFFPTGIHTASTHGLRNNAGHYFGVNGLASAAATPLALWIGVHHGFMATLLTAACLYVAAGACLQLSKFLSNK